ncbi:MAG TPA: hypothetical protein VMH22_00755 [bacterium]|nr:hypothetical protein [bacterium]
MPAELSRVLRNAPAEQVEGLVRFGPRYALSGDRLAIESGSLAGTTLRIERRLSDSRADFAFYETSTAHHASRVMRSEPIAHCHFDRDPETGMETLWGIFVRAEYRHRRLATLFVRSTLRELMTSGERHWFAVRKLMQVDSEAGRRVPLGGRASPGSARPQIEKADIESANPLPIQPPPISLHNLGIGLVALRLGLRPEPDLERLLAPGNVKAVQALPPTPESPPGLLLRLEVLPGLLVAALIDTDTGHPLSDRHAYEQFVNPRHLLREALAGRAVIGNIDYILPRGAIEPFAARLANSPAEMGQITAALRRGARCCPSGAAEAN